MKTSNVPVRQGSSAEWAASTLVLADGEVGIDTDTDEIRVGDGTNTWSGLSRRDGFVSRGTAVLVAGTKTVADTKVKANSIILLTTQALGTVTAAKAIAVTARVANTSFTITSADNSDTSTIGYAILPG